MIEHTEPSFSEISEFSVTEISNKIKWILENNLTCVKIKGEISGYKLASSGHGYFSLKDQNAVIAATCWRHALARVNFKIEEGLEVVVTGKITAYSGQSKYQISADKIELSGEGAFMKILQERRLKLEKEGLFDSAKKKKLPFLPRVIGIITSPTGAVIRDIIHRITDRCHTRLIIWPVAVQGETSASEVSNAIDGFNRISGSDRPDLIIVARGGGSIEDLWSFNEEIVVRSAYNSDIPIISAVGHETDYTLLDLVADKRAPTPTAAAEFAVPVVLDLRYTINSLFNSIYSKIVQQLKHDSRLLESYARTLQYPFNYFSFYIQKIDNLSFRLETALPSLIKIKQQSMLCGTYLLNRKNTLLDQYQYKLQIAASMLDSMDYNRVLQRGFAMVQDEDGSYLSTVQEVAAKSAVNIVMKDGKVKLLTS